MNVRAVAWFALYMTVVLVSASVLLQAIGTNVVAAERAVEQPTAKDSMSCDALERTLTDELFAWYMADLKTLGPEPHKRGPYPGGLTEWEAARRNGAARCTDAKSAARLEALLSVRRHLEASSYLLSQDAGKDFALLRD